MGKVLLYVGTYTRPADYLLSTNGEGIYIFEFDPSTGELNRIGEMFGIDNPSFLSIDPQNQYLYANSEVPEWHEGLITAFAINPTTGALTYLNKQSTLGNIASYNTVDKTSRHVLMTNFGDRKGLAIFPINEDGNLSPASDAHEITEIPEGTIDPRQNMSRSHCVRVDPTNRYALVNDFGLDKIFVYQLDLEAGKLIPHDPPSIQIDSGNGPRHTVFHPNGQYVYVTLELSASVLALKFDSDSGTLEIIQKLSALPDDFDGESHCSDIHVTPSGQYLYVGNRGHDSLAIYAIDESTGLLTLVGHQSSMGQTPRNFEIAPSGKYVLVANQDSDNIVIFEVDENTGQLIETGVVTCPTPVCLKFAEL